MQMIVGKTNLTGELIEISIIVEKTRHMYIGCYY